MVKHLVNWFEGLSIFVRLFGNSFGFGSNEWQYKKKKDRRNEKKPTTKINVPIIQLMIIWRYDRYQLEQHWVALRRRLSSDPSQEIRFKCFRLFKGCGWCVHPLIFFFRSKKLHTHTHIPTVNGIWALLFTSCDILSDDAYCKWKRKKKRFIQNIHSEFIC